LDDSQKRALIFLREVGAIDNAAHRQINGIDMIKLSTDLRDLRDKNIILQKGKGRSTYYIPNYSFQYWNPDNIDYQTTKKNTGKTDN
jgi:ATP-dependent DNA helicase RecG